MRTIMLGIVVAAVCFIIGWAVSRNLAGSGVGLQPAEAHAEAAAEHRPPATLASAIAQSGEAPGPASEVVACEADTAEAEAYRRVTAGAHKLQNTIRFGERANVADRIARADVARLAEAVQENIRRGYSVRLIGHTDAEGVAVVNRRIAMDRAEAARASLEQRGVFGIQVESAGEMCPIASNDTPEGREANRRVEIWLVRET